MSAEKKLPLAWFWRLFKHKSEENDLNVPIDTTVIIGMRYVGKHKLQSTISEGSNVCMPSHDANSHVLLVKRDPNGITSRCETHNNFLKNVFPARLPFIHKSTAW